MEMIEVEHFIKDYDHVCCVSDISFKINQAGAARFLGTNESGKSSSIHHLIRFSEPNSVESKILRIDSFENYYMVL